MPRYDVVIPYWDKLNTLPLVLAGLEANREYIDNVHIVHDGPYDDAVKKLAHQSNLRTFIWGFAEHSDFGVARCINLGMERAQSPSILVCDADVVIGPDTLRNIQDLAPLQAFSFAGAPSSVTLQDYPDLPTFIGDPRQRYTATVTRRAPFHLFRGGLFLADRQHFLDLGGWNTSLTSYGLQDTEFAARWLAAYGQGSFAYSSLGPAWHIGDAMTDEDRKAKQVAPANRRLCARALAAFFGHRYNLGSGDNPDSSCLNVDITVKADVRLDCSDISWIPANTASFIRHEHLLEHLDVEDADGHLAQLARALRPGGKLELAFPDLTRCAIALINGIADPDAIKIGIFGTPARHADNPYELHRWGWSQEEVVDILTTAGLVIDYAGPETRHAHRAWRDTFIRAHKPSRSPA